MLLGWQQRAGRLSETEDRGQRVPIQQHEVQLLPERVPVRFGRGEDSHQRDLRCRLLQYSHRGGYRLPEI
ncbi:hypothetical protein CTA2_6477, partial [Colletotrichum tanaceti]